MTAAQPSDFNWNDLGFEYHELPKRYRAYFKDDVWSAGALETDPEIKVHEAATGLHYGQNIFEGLKAYRRKDGGHQSFPSRYERCTLQSLSCAVADGALTRRSIC